MQTYSCSWRVIGSSVLLLFAGQALAGPNHAHDLANSIDEKKTCGYENTGMSQYIENSDQKNAYEVTIKTTEMHQGNKKESEKTYRVKAGASKYVGCTMSIFQPPTNYQRVVVKENKSPN